MRRKVELLVAAALCGTVLSDDSFDSRTQWPSCIGPVLNQDTCGSCYAFSSTGVLSDRLCVQTGKKTTLSPQSVVSCDVPWQDQDGKDGGNGGCEGAAPYRVFTYLENYPITSCSGAHCHEGCMPYVSGYTKDGQFCDDTMTVQQCTAKYNCNENNNACDIPECPYTNYPSKYKADAKCTDGSSWTTTVFSKSGTPHCVTPGAGAEAAIKAEIKKSGPMTTNIVVCFQDPFWRSGKYIYNHTSNPSFQGCGGHAVTITGWGEDGGIPYWDIRNSWGTNWGLTGYFKMRRGSNFMQVEEAVCGATPTTTSPATNASEAASPPLNPTSSFVPGAWFEDDVDAEHIRDAVRVYQAGRHEPYSIKRAESQIVNGVNHRIVLHVGSVGGSHKWTHEHRFTVHHAVGDAFRVIAREEPQTLLLD